MNTLAFPDHTIDPKKKNKEWILQYTKAAHNNWERNMPEGSIFMAKAAMYNVIRQYAMARQDTVKHQKELLPDDESDESYTKISWKPRADGAVIVNIAKAKLQKTGYNILATPINPQAKDAQDDEYARQKVKIMMREAMEQVDPKLAEHPQLKRMPGEADDLEELQMEIDFNPKFARSKDIEESVQLVFYENQVDKLWDMIAEDIVDFGVGVCKDDLDENNKVVLRHVYPGQFACSATRKGDFSDITWAYEVESVKISDLSKYFGEDDIQRLVNQSLGRNGNPKSFGYNTMDNNGLDIFKVNVVNIEFLSWDKRVIEETRDENGNLKISKAKPSKANTTYVNDKGEIVTKEQKGSKFTAKTVENIYKAKWVEETDLIYAYGKAENQKRTVDIATMGKTKLSYHIAAASFHNMRATGLTEAIIPIIDDLDSTTFKLRMFKNRMVPNGFDIDLSAIENVAIGKGGKVMTPRQVIDMFFETGVLVSRRSGISMDSNVNYKAINAITNNMADQLIALAQDLQNSKQALRDITGLNELTDGSTPNPKTLTTIANLANESTNNALYYLINARRNLIESAAKATVQRLQVALKRGAYDGFNKSAGRWISVPESIKDYDYDIMIEDKPSDDQKQILFQLFQKDMEQGFLDTADAITIMNTSNIKHAQMLLSFKVKKNKERAQNMALQNTQAAQAQQMQSNVAAETLKDKMAEKQKLRQIEIDNNSYSWQYEIAKLKVAQADAAVEKKVVADILLSGQQPAA